MVCRTYTKISQQMTPKATTQQSNTKSQTTYIYVASDNTFYQQQHLEIKWRENAFTACKRKGILCLLQTDISHMSALISNAF